MMRGRGRFKRPVDGLYSPPPHVTPEHSYRCYAPLGVWNTLWTTRTQTLLALGFRGDKVAFPKSCCISGQRGGLPRQTGRLTN
jgi:hypothetical protein